MGVPEERPQFGNYFGLRGVQLQIAVGCLAGLDFLLFGYDQGVTGGLLTLESFRSMFPAIDPDDPAIQDDQSLVSSRSTNQGIAVASYNLGCFVGKHLTQHACCYRSAHRLTSAQAPSCASSSATLLDVARPSSSVPLS